MTKDNRIYTIDDLIEKTKSYIDDEKELSLLKDTFSYTSSFFNDDDEYKTPILAIAMILTTVYVDVETIMVAFLSPLIEKNYLTRNDVENKYGERLAKLSYGLAKLNKINLSTENEYLIDYYKKIIVGISDDVKVIIVKLAKRVYEMRNLWRKSQSEQKVIAKETLEIIAPIAHHLGIHKLKSELEDLSLKYLKPEVFQDIASKLNSTKIERDNIVNEMLNTVSELLKEHNIVFEIKGRSKSIYSIYNKLDKGRKFSDIYDLLALRILVEKEQDCYLVLGIIHSKFKPIPKRFKDYIAMPKSNGYQSLHTTVFGLEGNLFEIQIRTKSMNEIAENGVASHWSYKENRNATKLSTTDQKLEFFKSLIEANAEAIDSLDFMNSVKESSSTNIYVFTPKGDVIELPVGSTPIDFAYKVHTQVGNTMTGAIVNDTIVTLNYELQDNDIVKIITNKNKGPSKSWLKIAKCTNTKNKIKAFFTKNNRELFIERGKYELERHLRKSKIAINDFYKDSNLNQIYEELKIKNLEELYLNVGNNKYSPSYVTNIIYKEEKITEKKNNILTKILDNDIIVSGVDKVKVNMANCCLPIPGDELVGYITKNNGITVHKKDCHNLSYLDNRLVEVAWGTNTNAKYLTAITIELNTIENKIFDIMKKLSNYDVNIELVNTIKKTDTIIYEIDLYVRNLEQLTNIIISLQGLNFIRKVERLNK
jgi:GTP pyrophosphokinase